MQTRRRHCEEGRDIIDPRRKRRAEWIWHCHARGRDQHIGNTSQLLLCRKIAAMGHLEKRVDERVRDWGVVVQDTLETETSFLAFGNRAEQPGVLQVL